MLRSGSIDRPLDPAYEKVQEILQERRFARKGRAT